MNDLELVLLHKLGKGGSGTSDYNNLTNKPQINGVTLVGDKSLSDLGIDIDTTPTQGSSNLVTSGGVYTFVTQGGSEVVDAVFYDGFSMSNTTAIGGVAPCMINANTSGTVQTVQLNIATAGTLSIGTIDKTEVTAGASLDTTKVKVHEVMTFTHTGSTIYTLETPMEIKSNEYIVLYMPTDTAKFNYGNYGTDKGFFYVGSATHVVTFLAWSIGVKFAGVKTVEKNISTYKGKTLSILGDSISTFSGYIPSGNATYYPRDDVQSVNDTWWKKLADALGMTLNVNNSWSGSYVTTVNGATSAGCGTRAEALGESPDVIIVWLGINDFCNEVGLGTYDGTTAVPATTTTFREAYAIMLNKVLTKYKTSEVWVCTLPQCEKNGEAGFPEINGNGVALVDFNKAICELAEAFGVKVLDHNRCGLNYQNISLFEQDSLHPNKSGHSLIANNDIRQMDNFVRMRY